MGIRARFLIILGVLSALSIVAIGFSSYSFSKKTALKEAQDKGEIIFNYVEASRNFFGKHQWPLISELVEKDRFFPELMSGFVVSRVTHEIFKQKMGGGIDVKYATIDPLYPPNKANADELKIINHFKENPKLAVHTGLIDKDGQSFYFRAKPMQMGGERCLLCHGDPADAPKDQVEIYGSANGYNWKTGEVVCSLIVYIPVSEALDAAKKSAMTLLIIGAGGLLVALFIIAVFLEKAVVAPILQLNSRAEEISLGKNMDTSIETKSDDEIGSLARAIDRLRISIAKMLQRR